MRNELISIWRKGSGRETRRENRGRGRSRGERRRGARGEQRRGARRDEARGEERREASGREARRDVRPRSEKNGRERRGARREETRADASEREKASERERKPCAKKTAHDGSLYIGRRRRHLGASNAPHIKSWVTIGRLSLWCEDTRLHILPVYEMIADKWGHKRKTDEQWNIMKKTE